MYCIPYALYVHDANIWQTPQQPYAFKGSATPLPIVYVYVDRVIKLLPCCSLSQMNAKAAAKRNIDSVSRGYVHAKRASAELENCTRGLIRGGTSVPLQGTSQEVHQVGH